MGLLANKRVLLGVSGGIAAYKTPELVRRLQGAGADVRVIVTEAGARFVSPLSLEVVSGHAALTDLWRTDGGADDKHIVHTDIGQDCDLIVLAPATANLIARIRHGFADDLLATAVMACSTPVLLCPSMNTDMLSNPLVRQNLAALETLGRYTLLEPGVGLLACGVTGPGRLPDPPVIIEAAASVLTAKRLRGVRLAISAGPTREFVDPVRFLTNRSTGTMGVALARAFAAAGAEVTLIAGPMGHATPVGVARRVDVVTAAEMANAVAQTWDSVDVLLMAAAVADFRPATVHEAKVKKTGDGLSSLALARTEDILASAAARPDRSDKVLIGFAAETHDVVAHARGKLARKDLDWIVANDVSKPGVGFGTTDNAGTLIGREGSPVALPRADKSVFAVAIVDALTSALRARFPRD